jgi:predicted N-acyltransferase
MSDIDRAEWDTLVGASGSPFLEWDWLASLEESGCVSAKTGWAPHHIIVRDRGRLVAGAPLYLKSHSQGEFVFDHTWADAAHRARIEYYPKLLVAIPFTPATGGRFLTHPEVPRAPLLTLLAGALREICVANQLSSVHVNFCESEIVEPLRAAAFLHRQGVQYQWRNRGYTTFDDYLADLRSKRRNQIRRERRDVMAAGIAVTVHEGEAIDDALFAPMFRIYLSTIEKMYWGRQYLNEKFFGLLRDRFKRNLCFIVARRDGEIIAGTVNVQKNGVFYGRYWGAHEEVRHLHFEVCYYAAIEHCITRGLVRFEPGAGGEFKYWRGFDPTPTDSMHFIPHAGFAQAVGQFLERERAMVTATVEEMRERGALKPVES